jgi:hypothetical protein
MLLKNVTWDHLSIPDPLGFREVVQRRAAILEARPSVEKMTHG